MPVALLNELVLMAVGLFFGYKTGKNKEKLSQFMKDNDISSYRDAVSLLRVLKREFETKRKQNAR